MNKQQKTPEYILSIRAPWVFAIADGLKDVENRKWAVSLNNPFASRVAAAIKRHGRVRLWLHAGKSFERYAANWINDLHGEEKYSPKANDHQLGGIVGRCELIDCVDGNGDSTIFADRTDKAVAGSEYFTGPYGLEVENASRVPFFTLKGQLGFWEPPPEMVAFYSNKPGGKADERR